jgi:transposase-like protein
MTNRIDAINRAIAKGGGIVRFARSMGVSHQAVYAWKRRGWVPVEKAVVIEAAYGVPRDDLMSPDLVRALAAPSASADLL